MALALLEAARARGRTHPNPAVGALVVRAGRVIARGFTQPWGGPHAEVMALREAGARARGADLIVTLEPCNHHGRTPPCTEAVIAAGVKRVFVGSSDPNPLVAGGGSAELRRAGVVVTFGVLRAECDRANEQWFKFVTQRLPWVQLKAAITLDGKLATASGDSRWVSSPESRALVHSLRDQLDAVLVGIGTALADDPLLTARGAGLRNPVRVVVDSAARLPASAKMLREPGVTLVACTAAAKPGKLARLTDAGAEILRCKALRGRVDLRDLLRRLAARGLTSVLVEGGAALHGALLQAGLWDELSLFVAPKIAGADALSWAGFPGVRTMKTALAATMNARCVGPDVLLTVRPALK